MTVQFIHSGSYEIIFKSGKNTLFLIFLVVLFIQACGIGKNNQVKEYKYQEPVLDSCKNEPDHKYVITLPEGFEDEAKLPLIIAIDPHGNGGNAVNKFTGALQNVPVIIAGSEKIRNNYTGFNQSLEILFADIRAKYPVDQDKIIIAGFSGGARMAFHYGANHKVTGIIMYGAGPGKLPETFEGERIYAVSGTRDFNFMEQYVPLFYDINPDGWFFADFFRGSHDWPPDQEIFESVVYILRDRTNTWENILDRIVVKNLKTSDSLIKSNDLFFAGKALGKAYCFNDDKKREKQILKKIDELKKMPGFNDYKEKFESLLEKELTLKKAYYDKLTDPDTIWWYNEINTLHSRIRTCTDSTQKDFYFRLKGFVGIILYSRVNELLQKNLVDKNLKNLLRIYEYAERDVPEVPYFKALYNYKTGNDKDIKELLKTAITRGFNDFERLKYEIPPDFWPDTVPLH